MAISDEHALRGSFAEELERLQRNVDASARVQFLRARRWDGSGTLLNVLTALLAGLAGVSTLAEVAGTLLSGILALAAAGLAAVATAAGAERKGAASAAAGNAYIEVRDAIRHVRLFDLPRLPIDDIRAELLQLTERVHAINKSAPVAGELVRRAVQRAIEREARPGEETSTT
ncbi:SLATT domain-containing protein [Nonomuraea rhodomycinica]|uniref:SLATT domain-containing protein n=1 Tax=Nonomuraea rhodomycinica TaxID=1712872 RepID=A0A7Y6IX86_9ACTN|nr:SLATT domain-containing protein [Nonomuraea rhodomycinica]NUW45855.1 SLATT domain-containing protein [Nonomuraea rhodomycinica]